MEEFTNLLCSSLSQNVQGNCDPLNLCDMQIIYQGPKRSIKDIVQCRNMSRTYFQIHLCYYDLLNNQLIQKLFYHNIPQSSLCCETWTLRSQGLIQLPQNPGLLMTVNKMCPAILAVTVNVDIKLSMCI